MQPYFNTAYPSIDDLRNKAKKRTPKFAFEYLVGGCNEDVNIKKNTDELREVELVPFYLKDHIKSDLRTELFGKVYDAPFGIAPIGLQGLIWPGSAEILAKAALLHNIPFILSTVSTCSIEKISEITEGNAWFQLYHPAENSLRNDIIHRLQAAAYPVLVILSDVPVFGYRPRDIRNGLAMPPSLNLHNILQIIAKPTWAMNTLRHGPPEFKTLQPYMPKNLDLKKLGQFMDNTFSGRLTMDRVAEIRDMWKGKLVLKGVASNQDIEKAIQLGLDGVIISNHGGRQLDASQSTIKILENVKTAYKSKIKIMMDSGIRTGPDIARAIASGSEFTFLGRSFMYGVAALGKKGGEHTIEILKKQLLQVMEQVCCDKSENLAQHLYRD